MKSPVSRFTLRISIALIVCLIAAIGVTLSPSTQASRGEPLKDGGAVKTEDRGTSGLDSGTDALFLRKSGFVSPAMAPPLVTLTVTRTDDRNLTCVTAVDCSLREAIKAANLLVVSVTINFSVTGTITLTAAQPNITNTDVSITGPGAASLTINQTSATARIFRATAGGNFSVSDVTISGGRGGALGGGAVLCGASPSNSCSFTNVVFRNNRTTGAGTAGGAIAQGGGGSLTISNCTFGGPNAAEANQATNNTGGAIAFDQVGSAGNLSITNSTFQGNNATFNGQAGGALFLNSTVGTMSVSNSTFINNHATAAGGQGGAVFVGNGNPSITLSRFFGNTAAGGGTGVYKNANPGTVTATDNWWGCDDFPGSVGCDTVSGSVTSTPRIDLVLTVESGDLCPNGSKTLTADVSKDTAGTTVNPTVMNGLPVTFALVSGPAGSSVSPSSATINGFMATSNFNGGSNSGTATVSTTVDNGTQTASVTINQTPTITSQPMDATVCDGHSVSFTVAVSGSSPTVQWQVSTDGGANFNDIPGATSATLTFTATQAQNGNKYRAIVSNSCGTATSNAATLTVNTAPTVSTNPSNQTVCDGDAASFTAAAGGSASTVQWQVSTNGGGSFSDIPGATSTTLTFTASTSQNGNQYHAVFTNACGTATTTAATLTVNANTSATTPADQTVCQGGTASFSTTASGTGPFHYAWTLDGSPFNGDSSSISVPTGSLSVGNHPVSVTVSGACGSTTKNATLTVQETTSATKPADQTVCQGATANFSTTASGTGPFHYAWTVDGSSFNGDSSSISVPTGSLSVGNHPVTVTVTGTCGSTTKNATLTVQANTSATTPADQTVCQGATANFSTTASGTGPFHYAWTLDGSPYNGDSSSISVPTGSLSVGNHPVTVTVSGTCGSVTKNATLTVQQNTSTTKPNDQTVCQGGTATFSTTASGTGPFTFVWKKGATVLHTGDFGGRVTITNTSTTSTLTISNVQPGDAGSYTVETTGTCGTATQSATLTVNSAPPTITMNGQTPSMWPPNHAYHTFSVTDFVTSASDACDASVNVNSVYITKVTSDEAENGPGSGNTLNDIVIASDCKSVQLRAEREGGGDGRVYTIFFKVKDAAGNFSTAAAKVVVPHSQNGGGAIDSGPHYTVTSACP